MPFVKDLITSLTGASNGFFEPVYAIQSPSNQHIRLQS